MNENREEQELELEALESIFQDEYLRLEDINGEIYFKITIKPFFDDVSVSELLRELFLDLTFSLPASYPDVSPKIDIFEDTNGHKNCIFFLNSNILMVLLKDIEPEVESNLGFPMVFNLIELIKDKLNEMRSELEDALEMKNLEHSNDGSMHSQMLIKQKQKELEEKQEISQEQTRTESEAKKYESHTPVTLESFLRWKNEFLKANPVDEDIEDTSKQSGKEFFMSQKGNLEQSVEDGEQALENLRLNHLEEVENINEELFLDEEEDLDDLDSD